MSDDAVRLSNASPTALLDDGGGGGEAAPALPDEEALAKALQESATALYCGKKSNFFKIKKKKKLLR